MADKSFREQFRGWSHVHKPVHPHAPAGGTGNGRSRSPGPNSRSLTSNIPHPDSPAGRHFYWGDLLLSVSLHIPGLGKSLVLAILTKWKKVGQPFSTGLMQHYVEGSGDPYDLSAVGNIPEEWQVWIVKETRALPGEYDLNPYNAKPFILDLKNSLGHFHVTVTAKVGSHVRVYEIKKDSYHFGFKPNDASRTGRHGLELHNLSDSDIRDLKDLLPTGKYQNPGGFTEGFEVKKLNGKWVLYLPQEVLGQCGKPFKVTGNFER